MNRIDEKFITLKSQKRQALIGYFTAGDPDELTSLKTISAACEAGLDILEIGVPFSDPTCDGPVIQEASQRALANGMTLTKVLNMVAEFRKAHDTPIVIFSYYNPIFKYGVERFAEAISNVGVDGVLIVDLPVEENKELSAILKTKDIRIINLVAPTTTQERLQKICSVSEGFLYVISRTGVTGTGGIDYDSIIKHVEEIKTCATCPVCVGFGISTRDDVQKLCNHVDGVIVGSAFVKLSAATPSNNLPAITADKVRELK